MTNEKPQGHKEEPPTANRQGYTIALDILTSSLLETTYSLASIEKELEAIVSKRNDQMLRKAQLEAAIRALGADPDQLIKDW